MKGYVTFVTFFEDENHLLLDCKAYSKIPDFKSLSHATLISLLMNCSDYLTNCQLVSFISQCFELRTNLINGPKYATVYKVARSGV